MREITYSNAINEALDEEMARDENVFIIGEDVGLFGGAMKVTRGLFEKYGKKRVIDTPISESAIIGAALGSALTGLRPIAEVMFIDFTTICMDQIANQVSKVRYMLGGQVKVPLVIRTQGGAGKCYAAQHSQSLESWFVHIPGLKVVMPATPYDAKGLLKSAIRDDNPIMFIENKMLYNVEGAVPETEYTIPLGKADIKRKGKDVTIVAHSRMVLLALEAAKALETENIDVEIVDLMTLDPLDEHTIFSSVKKTGRLITVEEGYKNVGIGAEVSARVSEKCFDYLDAPIMRLACRDIPIPCNKTLENATIVQVENIVSTARGIVSA